MPVLENASIADLVSACLRGIERSLADRRIRIVRQIDRTCPEVALDARALRGVIDTLLAEAAAATAEGGRLRVCVKHSRAAIMVSIKDQGPGFTQEEWRARVADPSRPAAPGAPMTLAACRDAVSSLGGNLFANALPGRGANYYVTLPPPR